MKVSSSRRRGGIVLSALAVAFLVFDGITKLLHIGPVLEATAKLGYPESSITATGLLVLIGTVMYAIPRTAPLGALYLTGFLGGAIAAHFRVSDPLFSETLFPVYVAAMLWGGLWLRDPRIGQFVLRQDAAAQ